MSHRAIGLDCLLAFGLTCVLCGIAADAEAETAQLIAVEDSWIYAAGAGQTSNYGSDDPLQLAGASGAYKRQCLLKWDLSSLGAVTVQSAQIVLTTRADTDWGGDLPAQLVQIDAAWDEMAVTWANQPPGSTVVSDVLTLHAAYADPWTRKTWTFNGGGLGLVQAWADGQPNYGVKLTPVDPSADSHLHTVRSREAADPADRPKLVVTYLSQCLPPGRVTDLSLAAADATRLELQWTAPAAMLQGLAVGSYELRYSTSPIDAGNFDSALLVSGVPEPAAEGTFQGVIVEGLIPNTTYYFAMKCHGPCDGLVSDLSNVLSASTTPPDVTPPAAVSDLVTGSIGTDQLLLAWTATGDDGAAGTADHYDVRYSTSAIDAGNFDSATPISQSLVPRPSGQAETLAVTSLTPATTYYFALKVYDESDNASEVSNVVSATTEALDVTPPAAITDLIASAPASWNVQLTWTAPGDDGVLGTAASYDVRYSTSPIDEGNWAGATRANGEPTPQPSGGAETFIVGDLLPETQYYFAVKTSDEIPNISDLSNITTETTLASGPGTGPTPELAAHYLGLLDEPDNLVDPWSFAFNPDVHIDRYFEGDNVNYIVPMFQRWASAQHKFGVIIGDLGGLPGADLYDQPGHLKQVYDSVAQVPPLLIAFGGHECEGPGKGAWLETFYPAVVPDLDGDNWDRYRYGSFDYRGIHFVILDTNKGRKPSPEYVGGRLSPEEWQWLEDDLDAHRGELTVVLLHEVVVSSSGAWYWEQAQQLIEVLYRYTDVKWLLQGHVHDGYRFQFEHISIINPRVWSDNLALLFENGAAQLCNTNADGSLQPVSMQFPDLAPLVEVPRAELTVDVAALSENRPGSIVQQVNVTAQFLDDPYANSSYTFVWRAPAHPVTGASLTLVAGGGPDDSAAVYAAPEVPAADARVYLAECTVIGNDYGNEAANAATVVVLPLADLDGDTDVDLTDHVMFSAAMLGPDRVPGNPAADLDGDGDCDLADFALFAASVTGP